MVVVAQTKVRLAVLASSLKSLSVQPLFDIAFSVSVRTAAGDPFDIAASAGLKQLLWVPVCPEGAVTVFSHMPGRILSCACTDVAALRVRHITADTTVALSKIICFLSSMALWGSLGFTGVLWPDPNLMLKRRDRPRSTRSTL